MSDRPTALELAAGLLAAALADDDAGTRAGPELIAAAAERLRIGGTDPARAEEARLLAVGAYFDGRGDGTVGVPARLTVAARTLRRVPASEGARTFTPIGYVRSRYASPAGAPLQTVAARGEEAAIELEPRYADGLRDLDGFSHAWLIVDLHRAAASDATTALPFLDGEPRGVFATRAPRRPNPLGLSLVEILRIAGPVVVVDGVDLVDGTPVLDVKPYVPLFDAREPARAGWLAEAGPRVFERRADDRYGDAAAGTSA